MTLRPLAVMLLLLFALPATVVAQDYPPMERPVGSDGGTYIKMGLAHWQGDIFNRQSLTQWNGDLFGSEYNLTSAKLQVEHYFDGPRLLLSGWAVGYRKDALRYVDSGHMFHAGAFRTVDFQLFAIKAGGGAEWGVPSLNFDTTQFDYRVDGAIRYNHVYPVKNVDIPLIGTRNDGALYPFAEISIVQRPGRFLLEGGMRINVVGFQFDDYEVDVTDQIIHRFSDRKVLMPYVFVNVGIRVF